MWRNRVMNGYVEHAAFVFTMVVVINILGALTNEGEARNGAGSSSPDKKAM